MYSLKEIRQYQVNQFLFIQDEAKKIHTKLLRPLSMREILDDNFQADLYQEQYNERILPLVKEYNKTMWNMVDSHLIDFLEGWVNVHPDGHFATNLSTGEYCLTVPKDILNKDELLFDVEISDYVQTVGEILSEYKIQQFWAITHCITYEGVRDYIYGTNKASDYIKNARKKFSSVKRTCEQLLDIAQVVNDLPNVNLPPVSSDIANFIHNSDLKKVVRHHEVLHHFFEMVGKDADGSFSTQRNEDGSIKGFYKF
jgi:hypothetical protein